MEINRNSRTFFIVAVAGMVAAAALGVGFLLGGQSANPKQSVLAPATGTPRPAGTIGNVRPQGTTDGGSQTGGSQAAQEPLATETPSADETASTADGAEEDTPSSTPTATTTPTGHCLHCLDGDLAIEPTPVVPCAHCLNGDFAVEPTPAGPCPLCNDLPLAIPVDQPPVISGITTSFCFPMLVVKFELKNADVVWFSFSVNGVTHEAQHIDADTFAGYLAKDVGYLSWNVYFISNLRIHAKDAQGNHVWSDPIPVPEPDLAC